MRFLVDQQLPPALARWLADQGHDATHVQDHGLAEAEDPEICRHALASAAAVVTKDADFAALSRRPEAPPIVWIRFGNARRATLLERMAAILPEIVAALEGGEKLVEVR